MDADGLEKLRAKFRRGSHGGKQMAKLSSAESKWLDRLIDCLYQDYPIYLESLFEAETPRKASK